MINLNLFYLKSNKKAKEMARYLSYFIETEVIKKKKK